MAVPDSERIPNAEKRLTDKAVSAFLDLDRTLIRMQAEEVAVKLDEPYRIVVCGGAGASKTTFGEELAKYLDLPAFDLDNYIPGGWTSDTKVYNVRFWEGLDNLWTDIPLEREWIVEHIEAAGPAVREVFKPRWAIHLSPGVKQLKYVSRMRDFVSGEPAGTREARAISSDKLAMKLFLEAPGKIIAEGKGWSLKRLS